MDMTLDVTQVLVGFDGEAMVEVEAVLDADGKPVLDEAGAQQIKTVPITLRPICINALKAPLEADRGMTGVKKTEIWELCGRLYREDKPYLLAAQVTLLQDRISASYGPMIVGPALLLLNGTPAAPTPRGPGGVCLRAAPTPPPSALKLAK
jgi:hypothetical protein